MELCECREEHERRVVVVTGGPGAGKTALLELVRRSLCEDVVVLPESAGIVFGGGFPRTADLPSRRAAQRAIYYVQRELEACTEGSRAAVVLCDRGTVDGAAYWPGPATLWDAVGTSLERELKRYYAVIHLRTPVDDTSYNRDNPLRVESLREALAIDARIEVAWRNHPRRHIVDAAPDFLTKVSKALEILREEIPPTCAVSPGG